MQSFGERNEVELKWEFINDLERYAEGVQLHC